MLCCFVHSGVAINFLEKPPQVPPQEGDEIIFHFNPRPKPPSRIILNTFRKGQWGTEVILEGNSVRTQIFKKMFVLSLKVLSHDGGGSEFLVFLNGSLLTTYRCRLDITKTEYIGFSPALRVVAHKNFKEEAKL